MSLRRRIRRLERDGGGAGDGDSLDAYLAEARALDAWLAERGLTPHEVLAAGLEGPPGLRWTSVALEARAGEDVAAWRRGMIRWPNRFSRMVGDKAFGLLVADVLGLPVPAATVLSRRLPPFQFGEPTGTGERWIRTCPVEQVPGRYTTRRGWTDPFLLLAEEDPAGTALASVLAQEGVEAHFSGALVTTSEELPLIEGVRGTGDRFMQGGAAPELLPEQIRASLLDLYRRSKARLGAVRFEWVHDAARAWVVQLHCGATESSGRVIFPGSAPSYRRHNVSDGLERLRSLIEEVRGTPEGIVLVGEVGVTSHMGDLLRKAQIPSYIDP